MSSNDIKPTLPTTDASAVQNPVDSQKETHAPLGERMTKDDDNMPAHASDEPNISARASLADTESLGDAVAAFPPGPVRVDTNTAFLQAQSPPSPVRAAPPNPMIRVQSTAIGPSTDRPVMAKDEEAAGPTLYITLLLTSGARHPFHLDSKYLDKRKVDVQDKDPYNLSVYKLKELILREWRDEWEEKPSNPSYIRLITMGKLLDDKAHLKDQRFSTDSANVVHMTIKPQDFIDEDDAKGGKSSFVGGRDSNEGRSPGCRCTVM